MELRNQMRKSQSLKALEYAKEKYDIDNLTLRELYEIRFYMEYKSFSWGEPTQSLGIYSGNLYREVVSRKNPKIARFKDTDNLWRYYIL